jgi:hypothetical protein
MISSIDPLPNGFGKTVNLSACRHPGGNAVGIKTPLETVVPQWSEDICRHVGTDFHMKENKRVRE